MASIVAVGTQKGAVVYRGEGSRGGWQSSGLLLRGWLVTGFARDAAGTTYAAVTHDVYGAAIMASEDLATWRQLEGAPRYAEDERGNPGHNRIIGAMDPMNRFAGAGRYVDQIWKLHAAGDVLYAGVSEAGVFRSDDRGKSWDILPGLNAHPERDQWVPGFGGLCAHSLLVDGKDPNRLWVGISAAGAYRSEDGGATFMACNDGVDSSGEGFCVHGLAHDPLDAGVIYRQDHRGVYRSDDAGDSWQLTENGLLTSTLSDGHECSFGFAIALNTTTQSVYIVPIESDGFRYPHDGQLTVQRSVDRGESWQSQAEGLPRECYANVLRGALAVDGTDPGGVYFGTTAGGVFGSVDGGERWQRLASELPKVLCVEAWEI